MATLYFKKLLNDQYIRGLCGDSDMQITDEAVAGLQLRYSAVSGRKTMYLWYRLRGTWKQRNLKLGVYEHIATIAEFRRKAMKYKEEGRSGLTRRQNDASGRRTRPQPKPAARKSATLRRCF